MLKYFSLLILVVCLTSCFSETRTYIDYSIQNTSSTDITVNGADIIHVREISETISPGSTKEITNWTRMGRTVLPFEPEIIFSEDFVVLNANGDTLKKDFWNGALWMPDITNSQQSTFHKYVLEVADKDF